ncbi:MAG: hypothetical protein CR975_02070 [Gammaproteobacteria bacterium]|nr:MAG: hypothetical protein CR975_02070 [Gammaproteobacteria bacterium]
MPEKTTEWLIPTIAGMGVGALRRFRRRHNERWRVVFGRFLVHSGTCVIAGYIAAGLLNYFNLPGLIAPVSALAGLYGTMLVDWLEEVGLTYLDAFAKSYLDKNR